MIKKILYISDLDGTLLNDNVEISNKTADILLALTEKGMLFSYATARSYITANKVTAKLKCNIPVIVYNGCAIVDNISGKLIWNTHFSEDETDYLKSLIEATSLYPLVYSYINDVEKVSYDKSIITIGMERYLESRKGDSRINPLKRDELFSGKAFYITLIDDKEKLNPIYEKLKDDERFYVTFQLDRGFKTWWLEIMPKSASKKNAILKLKEITESDYIVSFGDAVNDIPMFNISDECYAVENAVNKLKKHATGIIGDNNHDGVAVYLQNNYK